MRWPELSAVNWLVLVGFIAVYAVLTIMCISAHDGTMLKLFTIAVVLWMLLTKRG